MSRTELQTHILASGEPNTIHLLFLDSTLVNLSPPLFYPWTSIVISHCVSFYSSKINPFVLCSTIVHWPITTSLSKLHQPWSYV
jgi:hypothetical protein